MSRNWTAWLKAAGIRAIRTFAQTAVSMITVGQAFADINWQAVVSISGVAAVLSILTSLAGLPEVEVYHAQHSAPISQDQEEPEEQGTVHVDAEDIR